MRIAKHVVSQWMLLCCTALLCAAQWQPIGNVTGVNAVTHGMAVQAGNARVLITAISPSIIRVRYAPDGNFAPEESFAVLPQTGFTAADVEVSDTKDAAEFTTSEVRVRVTKSPLSISFLDPSGNVVLADDPHRPAIWNGKAWRAFKVMPEDEHYFGLGEKAGPLDHRGQAFVNWNTDAYGYQQGDDPLYQTIPFFIGFQKDHAYGLFVDNTYRSSFDFGRSVRDTLTFGAEGGELNYYFFYGPEPRKIVEDYTAMTGRTPLPPLFALGFQQSRYSYYPQSRVLEVANEFRKRKIPADVIYLDIDYQEKNRPFTVDTQRFPDFGGMIASLSNIGFKTIAITDLHIAKLPGYKPYDEGMANHYFVTNPDGSVFVGKVWPGDSVFPDFTRAVVRQWWGSLYRDFVDDGIRGFWNDMNEPALFFRADKTMPLDTVHHVDGRVTDHREIHNVFGMENACATYEGLLKLRPDERPVVLTRAAYAGAQRCAATWTGDNSSTWNHMKISIPMLLNEGVSGFGFVGDDIGGYAGSPSADLLTRWIELGAFNPFYRDHTEKGSADQEPWVHGPEHEAIRRKYIDLRYELLPYTYTAVEAMSRTGVPLMRPMFLDFPNDADVTTNDSEFMFGDAFLVAPKLTDDPDPVHVTLPAGDWYDFWTGKRVKGGDTVTVNPKIDEMPVYTRAGSIVPEQPVIQYVGQTPQGPLSLHVYPGPNCRGSIYMDDGNTFAYKHGEFQRTSMTCEASSSSTTVSIASPEGTFVPWWKEFNVVVHGISAAPRSVSVNGSATTNFKFDRQSGGVSVLVPAGRAQHVVVRY